ncbi:hypothetical protein RJT34_08683 [Clitoria ternatea]|uniref:Uncharacterized protein n=1 Tax=Clitoria ternatea TaxID=43366 RepID=A0AAN9K7D9_CLITE
MICFNPKNNLIKISISHSFYICFGFVGVCSGLWIQQLLLGINICFSSFAFFLLTHRNWNSQQKQKQKSSLLSNKT